MDFALQIPGSWRVTANESKRLFRRAIKGIVPDSVLSRPKQGFEIPLGRWFRVSSGSVLERKRGRCFVGGVEGHYNVACALRAFALIQRRQPDALLTVAGDGPQRAHLRQLARDLSLRNIRFVGRVQPEHMPALYDEHDVWLNGSEVDNMPMSILEAYACGLAVASTNPGGIPYIVEDGRTGRLVQCGDAEALAEAAL